jgi:hypothetical protein
MVSLESLLRLAPTQPTRGPLNGVMRKVRLSSTASGGPAQHGLQAMRQLREAIPL